MHRLPNIRSLDLWCKVKEVREPLTVQSRRTSTAYSFISQLINVYIFSLVPTQPNPRAPVYKHQLILQCEVKEVRELKTINREIHRFLFYLTAIYSLYGLLYPTCLCCRMVWSLSPEFDTAIWAFLKVTF